MGKGGGGGYTQSTGTTYTTNLPEYARPYVETMLGATQQQLFTTKPTEGGGTEVTGFQPYRAYGSTYDESGQMTSYDPSKTVAGFQPLQETAQRGIAGLQVPGQYGAATEAAMLATQGALGAGGYQPGYFGNQFRTPAAYQPGQFGMVQAQAPELQQYQMGPAERVGTGSFTQPGAAAQYMSPYIEQALAPQLREAQRTSEIQRTVDQAQATRAGAFGGGRQAIIEAERQRNLATQMGDIRARGLQGAYEQAQQLYGTEAQRQLAAQQANQQAGLTVGQQNLAAQLGIQQLGAGQNLQAQLANQQAYQAAQQAAEQSRQYGYGQGMTGAQLSAQYGLAGQQAEEQSRQFGAGLGMQGLGLGLQGAGQIAGIGGQQLAAQQGIYGLQAQTGAQQQALEQQKINQAVQDYANAQQYPLMQLGFMSNMLRGLPMQSVATQQYTAQPNYLTQGIGALGAGASIYNAFKAKGGVIKEMAKGGITSVPRYDVGGEVYSDLLEMSVDQLKNTIKESSSQRIKEMAKGILAEKMTQRMYGGGIVAFQAGGNTEFDQYSEASVRQPAFVPTTIPNPRSDDPLERARARDMEIMERAYEEEQRQRSRTANERLMQDIRTGAYDPEAALRQREQADEQNRAAFASSQGATPAAPTQPAPAQPAPATAARTAPTAPSATPAGITAAPARGAGAVDRAGEVEAQANLAARKAASPVPLPSSAQAIAESDLPEYLKALQREATTEGGKSLKAIMAERQAALKEAGVSDVAEGRRKQRENLMAERANTEDEARRQRYLRLGQLFAKWGQTPGSTLAAGLRAFDQSIEGIITDEKEYKKIKRDLDKSIADMDQADRLEKVGEVDAAMRIKMDNRARIERVNDMVFKYQTEQQKEKATAEREGARDRATAKRQEESDLRQRQTQLEVKALEGRLQQQLEKIRASGRSEEKSIALFNAAVRTQGDVEAKIGNIMKGPEYTEASRLAQIDPEGKSPQMVEMIKTAKQRLERYSTDFGRLRRDAEEAVARSRAKVEGVPYTAPSTTPPPGGAGGAPSGQRRGLETFETAPATSGPSTRRAPAPAPTGSASQPSAAATPGLNTDARVQLLSSELAEAQKRLVAAGNSTDRNAITLYAAEVARLKGELDKLTR